MPIKTKYGFNCSKDVMKIVKSEFENMRTRRANFKKINKQEPKFIYLQDHIRYIMLSKFIEMERRYLAWKKANNNTSPAFIWVVKPAEPTPPPKTTNKFRTMYFINPDQTKLADVKWDVIKKKGITGMAVRITNTGTAGVSKNDAQPWMDAIIKNGLEPFAWVWYGFSYTSEIVKKGWNVLLDMEVYGMNKYIDELKAKYRQPSMGKIFLICAKPDGWDGEQFYDKLAGICDGIVSMAYTGDYNKSLAELTTFAKQFHTKYPGKLIIALETYYSDKKPVAKTNAELLAEINAVKKYCSGIMLFRYGLDNYLAVTIPKPTPPPEPEPTPTPSGKYLLQGDLIRILPYDYDAQDTAYTCGDSTLKMIFSSYGITVTEAWLAQVAWTNTGGTGHEGLLNAVKSVNSTYGRKFVLTWTSFAAPGINGLAEMIRKGQRFILHIMTGSANGWRFMNYQGIFGHYIMLVGVNPKKNTVVVADPAKGANIEIPYSMILTATSLISQPSLGVITEF